MNKETVVSVRPPAKPANTHALVNTFLHGLLGSSWARGEGGREGEGGRTYPRPVSPKRKHNPHDRN